jgi:hypothetical protein
MVDTERFRPENIQRMRLNGLRPCDKIVSIPPGWEVAPEDDPNVAPFCVSFTAAIAVFGVHQYVHLVDGSSHAFYANGHGHVRRSSKENERPTRVFESHPCCLLFRKRA